MKNFNQKALRVKDLTQKAKLIAFLMIFVGMQVNAAGVEGIKIALITVGVLVVLIFGVLWYAKSHHEFGEDA